MADHQFPQEIMHGILSRLPIKSLARFRCVCKQWFKYINDPYLVTIHRVEEDPTPIIFEQCQSLHPNKINKQCKISFLCAARGTNIVQKSPALEFCYRSAFYGASRDRLVLGSCNGLTLVCYQKDSYLFAVINPLCKQHHDLPPISITLSPRLADGRVAAGIGFDDSTNTLKTVFVCLKERVEPLDSNVEPKQLCTMVHDLGMGSWREIAQTPDFPIKGEGVFGHGRLHWLVSPLDWRSSDVNDRRKIVWFDVKTEEFGLTDPPTPKRSHWQSYDYHYHLVDLNGEVGFAYIGLVCNELWILKRDGWVLHCLFVANRMRYMMVSGRWNKDGDILLTCDGGERLFVHTLKTHGLREVDWGDRCKADVRMYQSSLFSIHDTNTYSITKN